MKKLLELVLPIILVGSMTFAIENFYNEHYFNTILAVVVIFIIFYDVLKNNRHKN